LGLNFVTGNQLSSDFTKTKRKKKRCQVFQQRTELWRTDKSRIRNRRPSPAKGRRRTRCRTPKSARSRSSLLSVISTVPLALTHTQSEREREREAHELTRLRTSHRRPAASYSNNGLPAPSLLPTLVGLGPPPVA